MKRYKTIYQLLVGMGACKRARKKYRYKRNFQKTFIESYWADAQWFVDVLFTSFPLKKETSSWPPRWYYPWYQEDYPRLTGNFPERLMNKKANRIKYWPEIEKRLKEIGVEVK